MKILKGFQIFTLFLGLYDISALIAHLDGSVGCRPFDFSFYIRMALFCISLGISCLIYRKGRSFKDPFLYAPLIFVFNVIFYFVAYRMEWFHIYEQWVGGAKTWTTFADPGSDCDYFFMRLFKYTGNYKEVF